MNPHYCSKRVGNVDPGGVANLYGLWDWVGMASLWAYSLWAGLCPEKLVKLKKLKNKDMQATSYSHLASTSSNN